MCKPLSHTYPKKLENRQFEAHLNIAGEGSSKNLNHWLYGYRVETEPKGKVVQFNADNFSFSWLRPYDTWESFIGEARENWEVYEQLWKPTSVVRIGTRFINRIAIPTEALDFDDYFTAFPRIPPNLPQTLVTFLSKIVVPVEGDRTAVTITLALEDERPKDMLSVILDIDISREGPNLDPEESIWNVIDGFRDFKNKAFFDSLTNKALGAYI